MLYIRAVGSSSNYPVTVLTREARDALTEWYDNGRYDELVNPAWGYTDPGVRLRRHPRVGSLFWPVIGASRFAHGVFALDSWTLNRLRADQGTDPRVVLSFFDEPGEDGESELTDENDDGIDDETGEPITGVEPGREYPLYMIASRPVVRTGAQVAALDDEPDYDDLYLVTLVDARYYWVHQTGTGDETGWAPASWLEVFTSLFSQCVGSGGWVLDPVAGSYPPPSDRWGRQDHFRRPTAVLLDDAAQCVGSRIVVTPGVVHVQRPSAANLLAATVHADLLTLDERFSAGGAIDSDEEIGLPGAVRAVWPDGTDETAATGVGLASTTVPAWLDVGPDVAAGARTAALAQWAADWLAWQYPPYDVLYTGFTTLPASGFVGSAELYHDADTGYTRIQRPPLGWRSPVGVPEDEPDTCFPAELTGPFADGYPWRRITVTTGTWEYYEPETVGENAHTPDDNEDLQSGTRGTICRDGDRWVFEPAVTERTHCVDGYLHRQTSIDGGVTWEDDPNGPQQPLVECGQNADTGCTGTDWDWTAALLHLPLEEPPFSECLKLTVLSAAGFCAGTDTTQVLWLRTEDGITWTSQEWDCEAAPPDWVDEDFECDTGPGPAIFKIDPTTGVPTLQLCGVTRRLTPVCGGDGDPRVVVFGVGGTDFCNGTKPVAPCRDNKFRVRLECVCCSIDGWQGPGWYCVTEGDCEEDTSTPVELTDEDRCDQDIIICSCRFDSEEEANEECGPGGILNCSGTCSGYQGPFTLYAVVSGGNGTVTLTWDEPNGRWSGSQALVCGETLHVRFSTSCAAEYSCDGVNWAGAFSAGLEDCLVTLQSQTFTANMDNPFAGCAVGSCGSLTFVVQETP